MVSTRFFRRACVALFTFGCALTLYNSAKAGPVGASSAYGIEARLNVTSIAEIGLAPVAPSSGTTPGPYSETNQLLSLNQTLNLGGGLTGVFNQGLGSGLITTYASSTLPNANQAEARAEINNLGLNLFFDPIITDPLSLLTLSANTLSSHTEVAGNDALTAVGTTVIEGLTLGGTFIDGLEIDIGAAINPDPNTILLDTLGLHIILNEQITTSLDEGGLSHTTNAIHITFNNFLLGANVLNGDIIIANTLATIQGPIDVPTPSSISLATAGLLSLAFLTKRRRR